MKTERENLAKAIHCCKRGGSCTACPLQGEICDKLFVDMSDVPTELLDRIEKELRSGQKGADSVGLSGEVIT